MRRTSGVAALLVAACHRTPAPADGAAPAPAPGSASASGSASESAHTPAAAPALTPLPPPASSLTYPFFRKTDTPIEQIAPLVIAAPSLSRVGTEVSFFDPNDGSYIVRSSADHAGIAFTTQPVLWSPEPGQQVLVVSARGKTASFVAAWWLLPEGGYRLASSFVMLGEVAPVALAYKPSERTLFWTSCWQCPGETGHLSVRDDHHVVIVQD